MAQKTIKSSAPITFLDRTDSRQLSVYISSTYPVSQIYNPETGVYTPSWTTNNPLTLSAAVFIDSKDVTNDTQTKFAWLTRIGNIETPIGTNKTVTISNNVLGINPIITYICRVTYQQTNTAFDELTFTLVRTGTAGASAPMVMAQYSTDETDWTSVLDTAVHKYARYSYDGGKTWTAGIKIVGSDGTSVRILGSYDNASQLPTAYSGDIGDGYLIGGDLYIWNGSAWQNVGNISGPQGHDGSSSYLHIRYATDDSGSDISEWPTPATTHIAVYMSDNPSPPNDSVYVWKKYVGSDGRSIESVIEYYNVNNSQNTAPTSWVTTVPAISENTPYLWNYEKIIYSDNTETSTIPVVIGVFGKDGNGISSVVNYYLATAASTGVTKSTSGWTTAIQSMTSTNKYLWTYERITYTKGNPTETTPHIIGVYGDRGQDGIPGPAGVDGKSAYFHIKYAPNATPTANQMSESINTYIGTYVDNIEADSNNPSDYKWVKIQGQDGSQGIPGTNGADGRTSYLHIAYANNSTGTSGFSTSDSVDKLYIGQYVDFTQGDSTDSTKYLWSKVKGEDGVSAALVNITPSALYFKSTTGKDGVFTPDYIYLYPRFQSVSYSSWQYSIDGGTTWVNASGANGLTIGTYNLTANSLRIAKASTLYTDSITSVSFRCNSNNSAVYDIVSIVKIYDVVDLQIGGRNLARLTDGEHWSNYITSTLSFSEGIRTKRIKATCSAADTSASARFGIQQSLAARLMKLQSNQEYTLSFWVRGNVNNLNYTYLMNAGTNSNNQHIGGIDLSNISEISFIKVEKTFTTNEAVDTATGSYLMISYGGAKDTTMWFEIEGVKLEAGNVATDWTPAPEDMLEEASNLNVILSNEAHFFEANSSGVPTATSIVLDVIGYKGSIQSSTTVGTITGLPSTGMTATVSNNNTTNTKITVTVTTALTSSIADYGTLTIPITVNDKVINKIFSWSKSKEGKQGNQGNAGTPASLVKINPSALYFKSTMGKDGTFTPQYIYLYPIFQNAIYSNWQYSINGGTSWVAASGANGLSIATYGSVANSLRIDRGSTLFTDTVTSITFRCNTTTSTVYDTVSIAKIYDVVDLEIGGRNLIQSSMLRLGATNTKEFTISEWASNLISSADTLSMLTEGETYTISYDMELIAKSTLPTLYASQAGLYLYSEATTNDVAFYKNALKNVGDKTHVAMTFVCPPLSDQRLVIYTNRYTTNGSSPVGVDTVKFTNLKLEKGHKATDWTPAPEDIQTITFEVYAPNGYLLSKELSSLPLQVFANDGSIEITSGATYQWSHLIDNAWVAISGATGKTITVTREDVLKSKSYKCEMIYKSKTYSSTITVQDKTDSYNSIMAVSSNTVGNDCYWVLYTLVYNDDGEVDPLLGPISITAPASPTNGAYWYAVDTANTSVQLKKYNGSAWVNSTDIQLLSYYWDLVNDGNVNVPFGDSSKVQVISCHDFTTTATAVCKVSNVEDGLLTQTSLTLTDVSDPIVSSIEPTNAVNGQIWIKPNGNGTYLMFVWDEATSIWIASDMDTRNKVYTSKPTSYSKGDLWITESDTAHSAYLQGTLLQASNDRVTYSESDWSATLKYDKDIDEMKNTLNDLSQYVSITSLGLRIGARSSSGELSPFTSLFTSTELSFYQNSEKLLTLANNQLTAPKIVVEDDLVVQGTISLGNLKLVIESNGSFSFAVSK